MWVLSRGTRRWVARLLVAFATVLLWSPFAYSQPLVGLSKSASPPVFLGDRVFSTRIELNVYNMGGVRLNKLKMQDDLQATFADGVDWFEVEPGL